MAMCIAQFTSPTGRPIKIRFEAGDHVASQVGQTLNLGSITFGGSTQSCVLVFRDNFCWWPATALTAGWGYRYIGRPRTLHVVGWWQSNLEGRGFMADATIGIGNPYVSPNDYPYDYNFGGLGDEGVGPLLIFASTLLAHPDFPYERVSFYSAATGNTTIEAIYGTDGTDGHFAVQAGDTDVLAGPITNTGIPCLIQPGDDYITFGCGGEANRAAGTALGMGAKVQTMHSFMRNTYFAGANCLGHVLQRMCPTAPDSGQQASQDIANAEIEALEDLDGDPPTYLARYEDADMRVDETQHASTAGHERVGVEVANDIVGGGMFAQPA